MLNLRKYGFKIFAGVLVLAMALLNAPSLLGSGSIFAYTRESVTISNGTFVNTSSTSYPKSPSEWSVCDGSYSNESVKAGVISTNVDDFIENTTNYGLSINPQTRLSNNDDSILMINAKTSSVRYGYKSTAFTFDADSYYVISVDMRTYGESVGSIYVKDANKNIVGSFISRTTNSNWGWFRLFVETNELESISLSVELWLAGETATLSDGVVFFDNVYATKYTESDFFYEKENIVYEDSSAKYVSLKGAENITDSKITNANFEDDEISWTTVRNTNSTTNNTVSGVTSLGNSYIGSITGIDVNPGTNNTQNNKKALYINNKDAAGFGYTSDAFTIERFAFYKLSVYVKTGDFEEGGASIRLVPTDSDNATFEFTNVVSTKTNNSISNDWVKYNFYIAGSFMKEVELNLQLWVGNEKSEAKGYAFFDDVELLKISYTEYSKYSDGNTVKLASYLESKTATTIANAHFNIANTVNTTFPLAPASWTAENSANTTSGIIVANKDHFDAYKENYGYINYADIGYTRLQSDKSESATNNLLMVYNPTSSYQSYTSSEYSLAGGEDKYYKITVDVKTLIASGVAYVEYVLGENGQLAKFDLSSNTEWTTVTAYAKLGLTSKTLKVVLGLGNSSNGVSGYALFDNVLVSEVTSDVYSEAQKTENDLVKFADFTTEKFDLTTTSKDVLIGGDLVSLKTPANWTVSATDENALISGVVEQDNSNVLYLNSTVDGKYSYTSKLADSLTSGNYYTIKITIKTENLAQEAGNKKVDTDGKDIPYGVQIGVSEDETYISGINTSGEYVTYTIYINAEKVTTVTPFISLGYTDAHTSGTVYVSEILLESCDAEDFTEISGNYLSEDEDVVKDPKIIVLGATQPNEEEEPEEEEGVSNDFNWLLIPSLITGLAIIIAIVGVILKKSKLSKLQFKGKGKASYDRRKTLHPEVARRQAEEKRKAKLAELEAKMLLIDKQIKAQEEEYKAKREENLKNKEQAKAEAEFRAYAKKRAKLEKNKEKLASETEETKSDEYLANQEEKIVEEYEKEQAKTEKQEEEVKDTKPVNQDQSDVEILTDDDKK